MKSSVRQFFLSISALLFFSNAHPQNWNWVQDDIYLNPAGVQIEYANHWAWGDVNADGFVDIVISKFGDDGYCVMKAFAGTDRSQPPYWIERPELLAGLEAYRYGPIAIVDLDGDGAVNVVTFDFDSGEETAAQIIYWRRDVNGIWQPDSTVLGGNLWPGKYLSFADVDHDGDFDFLLQENTQYDTGLKLRFFENIGDRAIPIWREEATKIALVNQNPPGNYNRSPILMDANFDGVDDILLAFSFEDIATVAIATGVQDSSGTFWLKPEDLLPYSRDNGVGWLGSYDVNGDGFDDLLDLRLFGGRIYLADANAKTFDLNYFRLERPYGYPYTRAAAIDYNRDGSTDLLAATQGSVFIRDFVYIEPFEIDTLAGKAFWRNTHWLKLPSLEPAVFRIFTFQLTDIDRNGLLDLIVSPDPIPGNMQPLQIYERQEAGFQEEWQQRQELLAAFSSRKSRDAPLYFNPAFADLDADGDPDLLIAEMLFSGPDSGLAKPKFFENQLAADSVVWLPRADWDAGLAGEQYYQPAFADLDRDGDFDLVLGRTDSALDFYRNVGTQQFPAWQQETGVFENLQLFGSIAPAFADVDFDGDADLLIGSSSDSDVSYFHHGLDYYRNETIVALGENRERMPDAFRLYQNYPNPFNAETAIRYDLPEAAFVTIAIYDLAGRHVAQLVDRFCDAGEHNVIFDASGLASGIYFYRLDVRKAIYGGKVGFQQTCKLAIVK